MTDALWFPDAIRRPIPAGANDPDIIPIGNIFHIAVSEAPSLHDYFDGPSGGIESHGYIRRDGTVEQYRDAGHEADANYLGNSFVRNGRRYGYLSWETQGMGPGEWTPEQLTTIKQIITWSHQVHGTPLRTAPDWDQPGNGYHVLYPQWSNVPGKTCPGPDRIRQYHSIIEPWMTTGATTTPEDAMPDIQQLKDELVPEIVNALMKRPITPKGLTVAQALREASDARDLKAAVAELPVAVAAAVDAALPAGDTLTRGDVRAAAQAGAAQAVRDVLGSLNDTKEN